MATINVREIRLNGKKINNVNGKRLRALNYNGNTYVIQNNVFLTINTHNEYDESETWELEKGTYVMVNDYLQYVSANDKKIYAGYKDGFEFERWDKSSFNIQNDETINALWIDNRPLLGTGTIDFVWYESTEQLVVTSTSYSGEVGSSSVATDDYWIWPIGNTSEIEIEFYNTSGDYIGSKMFSYTPIEGDGTTYPSLTFYYYG